MNALLATMGTTGTTAAAGGSMTTTFITFGLIILIFYFLIIRPQKKREKETKNMLSAMKKGDKVVSIGGIRGTIASVKETTVVVKVDDNTRLEFTKSAIAQVLEAKSETASKPAADAKSAEPAKEQKAGPAKKAAPKKSTAKKAAPKKAEAKADVEDAKVVEETPELAPLKPEAPKTDDKN